MIEPLRVYYSFSAEDVQACFQLRKRLRPWRRAGVFGGAGEGAPERTEPQAAALTDGPRDLADAEIIVLLITPRYLQYEANMRREMRWAVARSEAGESWTIPVIVEACTWQNEPFARHGALPGARKAIDEWPSPDPAWDAVVDGLLEAAWRIRKAEQPPRAAAPSDPVLVQLTLDAVFESFDELDWHRLMRNLRLATADHDLRIRRVSRGSVVVDVECERSTADRLQELAQRRELHELVGFRVLRFARRKLELAERPPPVASADSDPLAETLGLDEAFAAGAGRTAAVGATTQPAMKSLARNVEAELSARDKREAAAATAVVEEGEVFAEPAEDSVVARAPFEDDEHTAFPEIAAGDDEHTAFPEVAAGDGEPTAFPEVEAGDGEHTAYPEVAGGDGEATGSPAAWADEATDRGAPPPPHERPAPDEPREVPTRRSVPAMARPPVPSTAPTRGDEPSPGRAPAPPPLPVDPGAVHTAALRPPKTRSGRGGLLWAGLLTAAGVAVSLWLLRPDRGPEPTAEVGDEGAGALAEGEDSPELAAPAGSGERTELAGAGPAGALDPGDGPEATEDAGAPGGAGADTPAEAAEAAEGAEAAASTEAASSAEAAEGAEAGASTEAASSAEAAEAAANAEAARVAEAAANAEAARVAEAAATAEAARVAEAAEARAAAQAAEAARAAPPAKRTLPSAVAGRQPCGGSPTPASAAWRNSLATCLEAIGTAPHGERPRLHSEALAQVEAALPSLSSRRVAAPARLAFYGDSALRLSFTGGSGVAWPDRPQLDVTLLASDPATGAVLAFVRARGSDPRPAVGWLRASDLGLSP